MKLSNLITFNRRLPYEAVQAYYNRLPENIQVKWVRDGEMIVGEVEANGRKYLTQGINANDFIDMVNDAVFSMEIPQKDIAVMKRYKHAYMPPVEELAKLSDGEITTSVIAMKKVQAA